jgi:hypothetical protein
MPAEVDLQRDVVRYASPQHCSGDVINGSAFELRPSKDIDGLSVNQLGIFSDQINVDLVEIRGRFRLTRKPTGRFAQINAGGIIDAFAEVAAEVSLVEEPLPADGEWPDDPSHALVLGLPMPGHPAGSLTAEIAGDLLVQRVKAVHPAV